jgi:phosphoenolpyruvate synthase/pyruvate phosphate dikinase
MGDPYEAVPDGAVLVSKITDTAWTPLFLTAAAVVTDVGGLLSHAMIVARELGIPAVVDTKVATAELRDGDLVEVDGAAGTVRVLERA